MRQKTRIALVALTASHLAGLCLAATAAADEKPADSVFRHGVIYTVDAKDSVAEALAIRDGRVVYVGSESGLANLIGKATQVTDLGGRMLMPGLVDGHMHPLAGGRQALTCNLDYAPLTTQQFQARIQACLDADHANNDAWLQVSNWYRQFMRPAGTDASRATLDALRTKRPILVISNDYHSMVVNSRALALGGITAQTPNPAGGSIAHDAHGEPTGILEDDARSLVLSRLPPPKADSDIASAQAALDAMRQQGITSFLDAAASEETLDAFVRLQEQGKLTARAHFAPVIDPSSAKDRILVLSDLHRLVAKFDQGAPIAAPGITVRNAKLFMDGVLEAPAQTAALLEPYLVNQGTPGKPDWQAGTQSGSIYFPPDVLGPLLVDLAKAGLDPHIHAIGDRAVRQALDALGFMRAAQPDAQVRPAIAHAELVDPADFGRFRTLDVTPVMSYQWAKKGPDSIDGARNFLGASRFARMEPEGSLYASEARIAYGSDWPVDRLDEWFALKVGVTRTGDGRLGPEYDGPFNAEVGLPIAFVLRSVTMNSSYALHQDGDTGSLEPGKLADLIVLDRNPLRIDAEQIAKVKVLLTMVGGKVVWRSGELP